MIQIKKLKELKPYANNPRINAEAVEYVKNSISEFGFKIPMVIDKKNFIVCGHTRYKACKELGLEEVPCVVANDLSEEQIKAFRLADNKTSEMSGWDFNLLDNELNDINLDMASFGFQKFNDINIDEFFEDSEQKEQKKKNFIVCSNCGKKIEI